MSDIHVFIVEDSELAKKLVKDYFNKDQITYASIHPESERERITKALELV